MKKQRSKEALLGGETRITLKKSINLLSGCALIVGTIVGSGVFISSKGVLENAGTPGLSLCVWLFSGLISLIGAICFTELGRVIQTSGGNYAYIKEIYGNFLGFLYIWAMVFVCVPCMNAVAALTISMYLVQLFTSECANLFLVTRIIAALVLCVLGYINTYDVKFISKIQMTFTFAKLIALFTVVCTALWVVLGKSNEKWSSLTSWMYTNDNKPYDFSKIALSLYNSLFSYSGWNSLNFLTEELENPEKNLSRAIFISIPIVILIYITTNVAYFIVLTPSEILQADTIALTFTEKVFSRGFLTYLTPFFISFSTFGGLSGAILSTSRIYHAAARDGNLPEMFSFISVKYFSPTNSIILMTVTSVLVLFIKDLSLLILFGTFSEFLFIGIAISGIIYLRYKRKLGATKISIAYPIFFTIICVFMVELTMYQYTYETAIGLLLLVAGIPVYLMVLRQRKQQHSNLLSRFMMNITELSQKMFLCVKEE